MGKLSVLAAGAAGYVLGARAGRERYEQIASLANRFWTNPRVQDQMSNATESVKHRAPDVASAVADAAKSAAAKVVSSSSDDESEARPRDEHGRFIAEDG